MSESGERLRTILGKAPELDLVALVYTPWHLAGAMALAHSLHEAGRLQRGLIAVAPHPRAGHLVHEESTSKLPVEVRRIRRIHPLESGWLTASRWVARFARNPPIVLATPHRPHLPATSLGLRFALRWRRPLHLTFLDEGLGTYRSVEHWVRSTTERDKRNATMAIKIPHVLSKTFLRTSTPPSHRNLLKENGDLLQPDAEIVASYRAYFLARAAAFEARQSSPRERPKAGAVIWLSQPQHGSAREHNEYIAWIRTIGEGLKSRGLSFWLKLHPRDSKNDYRGFGLSIIEETGALEEILPVLRPSSVVGRDSTGLVTAAALYGIPAFSVSGIAPFCGQANAKGGRELFGRLASLVESPTTSEGLLSRLEMCARAAQDGTSPKNLVGGTKQELTTGDLRLEPGSTDVLP